MIPTRLFIPATATAVFLLSTGCTAFTPPVQDRSVTTSTSGAEFHLIDYDATRRGSYIVTQADGSIRVAAEPPPDTVLSQLIKGSLSANSGADGSFGGSASGEVKLTAQTIQRALSVSLFRDASYRLAEAYANGAIDNTAYQTSMDRLVSGILELAKVEIEQARTARAQAEAQIQASRTQQLESYNAIIQQFEHSESLDPNLLGPLLRDLVPPGED